MTRRARAARLAALAAVLALLALERLRDGSLETAVPAPAPPAAVQSPPPSPRAPAGEARTAPARPRPTRRAQKPPAPPEPPVVSLDELFRIPVDGPQSPAPLELPPPPVADAPAATSSQRVRIDFSSDEPLAESPLPREWRRREAGVSVPVGEAERLRIRGGVRVDQRGEGEAAREVETTPSFGLEFRF